MKKYLKWVKKGVDELLLSVYPNPLACREYCTVHAFVSTIDYEMAHRYAYMGFANWELYIWE